MAKLIKLIKELVHKNGHGEREDADGDAEAELHYLHYPDSVKKLSSLLEAPEVNPNHLNALGYGPLHSLIMRRFKKKDKSLQSDLLYTFLTESDVEVNLANSGGNSPLHLACQRKNIDVIRMLLAFGANINQLNRYKKTPLDMSIGRYSSIEHYSMVEIIPAENYTVESDNESKITHLLKDFDALPGNTLIHIQELPKRSAVTKFVDVITREKDREKESDTPPKNFLPRNDWSTKIAMAYFNIETTIRSSLRDVTQSITPDNLDSATALGLQIKEMKLLQMAGTRMLCLDGGGMRGLLEIEILCEIEEQTGRRITELFDWIVGTSTGAIIALALVYRKMTLREIRSLFYLMKDPIFEQSHFGETNTEKFTEILKNIFGSMTMDEVEFPRIMVSAVWKKTKNLKVHFFSNHPGIERDSPERLVWKVARYTSAAPSYFDELDNYVDGGVLANNPSSSALTKIQNMYRLHRQKLPISVLVSIGSGKMPEEELGRTDAHQFAYFGKHWFKSDDKLMERTANLLTLLSNAITESEFVSESVESRCLEQGIDYYRFSPRISEVVESGETDTQKLIEMVLHVKKCAVTKNALSSLALRFPQYSEANRKICRQ